MAAGFCSGDQRLYVGVFKRKNLYGAGETVMFAGTKLLLLSGRAGRLPCRFPTGSVGQPAWGIPVLCPGGLVIVWRAFWTSGLWFFMSLWLSGGFALSHSLPQKEKESAGASVFGMDEVWDPSGFCYFITVVCPGYKRSGRALVL